MEAKIPKWLLILLTILCTIVLFLVVGLIYQNQLLEKAHIENLKLAQKQNELKYENENIINEKEKRIEALVKDIELGNEKIATLEKELSNIKSQAIFPSARVIDTLREFGFESSDAFYNTIVNSGVELPYEGVLGGVMKWYPSEFYLINEHWVLGYFEDGHVAGHALLKYSLSNQENVVWEIIAAELY